MPSLNYKGIQKVLGIRFKRMTLLKQALSHSSYVQTNNTHTTASNERLEFLGDAVLELITRNYLYDQYPDANEGELSELKKTYTSTEALYRLGKRLKIGRFLLLDKGEEHTGGRDRASNLAGAMEAIIGALYIDRGLQYVTKFICRILLKKKHKRIVDYKSFINKWAMRMQYTIQYRVTSEKGPPHQKIFYVEMYINGRKASHGVGNNKKKAEQNAAEAFIAKKKQKDLISN
jgi:ribonuclease-3